MTGGLSHFVRCFASVMADTPLADRWDIHPITARCIPVCVDDIGTLTQEQWEVVMAAKYGNDFEGTEQ